MRGACQFARSQLFDDFREPGHRTVRTVRKAAGHIRRSEILLHLFGEREPQFISHDDVERCRRSIHDVFPVASAARHGNHADAAEREQPPDFFRILPSLHMNGREPKHIDGGRDLLLHFHFLFDAKRGCGIPRLKASFHAAAVHRIDWPWEIHLVGDALHIVTDKTDAAVVLDKDTLGLRIGLYTGKPLTQIILRPVNKRIRAHLCTGKAHGRHRILIIHIFHRIKIAPERAIHHREAPWDGVKECR